MNVLEVKGLYKTLGKSEIIQGIDFSVKEGEIFGFLGPNGAGKTTTIRMLVGLIHPTKGSISIMGNDLSKNREKALEQVGAVVENPELYTYLSGRENLMQIARIRGISKKEVDEIIETIGLKEKIDLKVKKYSLGMKQRLGLGAALISNPKLLILDEPTNGLDPSGILDFREIVRTAARKRGTAVFISSHILSEVQELCDTVAFIKKGQIQSIESLKENEEEQNNITLVIHSKNKDKCKNVLNTLEDVRSIKEDKELINIVVDMKKVSSTIKLLVNNDVELLEFYIKHKGVEQRYMELVEGGER
ncbi:ABC transporter ATP-binding protein [Hathewaya limosa]|uniref:ABC-2 type transport system ATP-binding protein n=1 Tax=Hathewaya limosa TaxID=1536 RepID=A0ABU0JMP3_HATLI|nr:ABC transporter ATP-binding protein [Hathewaya limosa]MDQ0478341.1 ABC-2 type transport system ATP-binding protein [Hathewaya limosa]